MTILQRLGVRHPIVQAPLAGGGDTPQLVAAVSEAGGLGFVGAAYLSAEQILERATAVRALTGRPFGINLFAPQPAPHTADMSSAVRIVGRYHEELALPPPEPPAIVDDPFAGQLDAVLDSGASVFSFTFGLIPADAMRRLKRRMPVWGTATTVEEARALHAAGADGVIAQGSEAGGHRGGFPPAPDRGMVGTMALVPQIVDAVPIPVIASGGIMDGRGVAAALILGAAAVQMGTAFLVCDEAGIPDAYKDALLRARETDTRLTTAFSGRPARGLVNRAMEEIDSSGSVLPFPLQNALTRPMRHEAARQGRPEYLSLWAGQGVRLARRRPAAALVEQLASDVARLLSGAPAAPY